MSDLVERLQDEKFWYTPHGKGRPMRHVVAKEAADEIERLQREVDALMPAAAEPVPMGGWQAQQEEIERLQTKVDGQEAYVCDLEAQRDRAAGIINSLRAALNNASNTIAMQRRDIDALRVALEGAKYLSAEVKNDWDKGRVSVDAYHAALAFDKKAREALKGE